MTNNFLLFRTFQGEDQMQVEIYKYYKYMYKVHNIANPLVESLNKNFKLYLKNELPSLKRNPEN